MPLLTGFVLVLLAGLLQGTFILPMTMVRRWSWAHAWISFSLLGMLVFNWIMTLIFIPDILTIYREVPPRDLVILVCFGLGWGIGAVLFGLGMDRLGMALGYPIIMGLIASLGALIPLLLFFPQTLSTPKGLILLAGTFVVVIGIVVCSMAASRKTPREAGAGSANVLRSGLLIAVLAGLLSCLPNVGMAFGKSLMSAAEAHGIAETSAGNTVWALLFTFGCIVNVVYCAFLIIRNRTGNRYGGPDLPRNLALSSLMALMWIGSFYLYGAGAAKLGRWGVVVGWPLFISLSIVMGNIWGVWRGEWRGASPSARRLLNVGLIVLIGAVILIAFSNSV
jgi:L-rhamnose-H+ transport protein